MRYTIWYWLRSRFDEGLILPRWAIAVRAVLFPIDTWFWWVALKVGYQSERDLWVIEGAEFSARTLHRLSHGRGEVYRVTRVGKTVVLERVGEMA